MPGHMYGAIPFMTETEPEPETEPETETDTDRDTENGKRKWERNGTFNIRDFGLSTHIRSFVRVIFSVCLSVYLLDLWRFLYLPTQKRLTVDLLLSKSMYLRSKPCWPPTLHNPNYANVWS